MEVKEIRGRNYTPLVINLNSAFVQIEKKAEKGMLKTSEIGNQIKMLSVHPSIHPSIHPFSIPA